MEFRFKRHRRDKVSKDAALDAMERAAAFFGFVEFGKRDFDRAGVNLSASAVRNAFDGSWTAALEALRARLQKKGRALSARSRVVWSDDVMFEELRRVWTKLGHRPSKDEWNAQEPKISYNAYRQRFRGWQNACLRFIEYQMRRSAQVGSTESPFPQGLDSTQNSGTRSEGAVRRTLASDRRDPPQALVNKVWKRDNFCCRRCGKSPATHFGVVLEVDHVIPWAHTGKTTLQNLQTLCSNCNRSKRDEMPIGSVGV